MTAKVSLSIKSSVIQKLLFMDMPVISNKQKCMAALAVFRTLYDRKKNIYDVIAEFAKLDIVQHDRQSFFTHEMAGWLNEAYGMNVPDAVVERVLTRLKFVKKVGSRQYVVDNSDAAKKGVEKLKSEMQEAESARQMLIEALVRYTAERKNESLSDGDREQLSKDFYSFVIDTAAVGTKYGDTISSFVVSISNDEAMRNAMNAVRQGVIVYEGLSYSTTGYGQIDALDQPITLYLDTEVVFDMMGFNGELYKKVFDEFYAYAQQINQRNKKCTIRFRCFGETYDDIEKYFASAEAVVRRESQLDFTRPAMMHITERCHESYQVAELKGELYTQLAKRNVTRDGQDDYCDSGNAQYTIESNDAIEKYSGEYDADSVSRTLHLLSCISIKRKGRSPKTFRNIGHVLVTRKTLAFRLSKDREVTIGKSLPLAMDMFGLTNQFWMALNKGIAIDSNLPTSFDVVTKARMALGAIISETVSNQFKKIQEDHRNNNLSDEDYKRNITFLSKQCVCPERITADNVESLAVSPQQMDDYLAEMALKDERHKREIEHRNRQIADVRNESEAYAARLEAMARRMAEDENEKAKDAYIGALKEYHEEIRRCSRRCHCRKSLRNGALILAYALVLALFLLGLILKNMPGWVTVLSGLAAFIVTVAGFMNNVVVLSPLHFFFSKKHRIAILLKCMRKKYLPERPKLKTVTTEDVLKRFES